MKNILILILLTFGICFSQNPKRKLVWEENFNGSKLDEKTWNFELGNGCPNNCGWGNNEKQIYTNSNYELRWFFNHYYKKRK